MTANNTEVNVSQVRPWVRYFARFIDIALFSILILFIRLFSASFTINDVTGFSFVMLIIWMIIEAKLISTYGFTIGKKLLNIKVVDANNKKLTFSIALKRSFLVWLLGLGLGILSFFTMLISFFNLRKEKISLWDKQCKSIVVHNKVGIFRIIITIIIFLVFFVIISGVSQM